MTDDLFDEWVRADTAYTFDEWVADRAARFVTDVAPISYSPEREEQERERMYRESLAHIRPGAITYYGR